MEKIGGLVYKSATGDPPFLVLNECYRNQGPLYGQQQQLFEILFLLLSTTGTLK